MSQQGIWFGSNAMPEGVEEDESFDADHVERGLVSFLQKRGVEA